MSRRILDFLRTATAIDRSYEPFANLFARNPRVPEVLEPPELASVNQLPRSRTMNIEEFCGSSWLEKTALG